MEKKYFGLFLACFYFCVGVLLLFSVPAWSMTGEELLEKILERGRGYLEKFTDRAGLLQAVETGSCLLKLENPSTEPLTLKDIPYFYDLSRIEKEIAMGPGDSPEVQVRKIFRFVQEHREHAYPLHENDELHNPPRFFSVYGCGFCDDAASNMAYLAAHHGYRARTWWIEGHVVALVFHDGKWRVYDPDKLGIIRHEGQVADMEAMVLLANQNKLAECNEMFSSTHDNKTSPDYPAIEPDDPFVTLLPQEKRMYLKLPYMLTNDGHFLDSFADRSAFVAEYENRVANYVRIIPLIEQQPEEGKLSIEDYFPFAGVFIRVPFSLQQLTPEEIPWIGMKAGFRFEMDGQKRRGVIRKELSARKINGPNADYRYFDLSLGTNPLEPFPSRSITIGGLEKFLKIFPEAQLITVHQYSLKNARFE